MDIANVNGAANTYGVQGSAPAAKTVQVETPKVEKPEPTIEEPAGYKFGTSEKEESGEAAKGSIMEAVKKLNASTDSVEAVFGVHDDTNRVTIKMIDKASKDVLKEFPAEQTLDMIAKVWEMAGILVDEKR